VKSVACDAKEKPAQSMAAAKRKRFMGDFDLWSGRRQIVSNRRNAALVR
jgi:hypothetical protein